MFRSEALLGALIQSRGSSQRETLDNMVSAARSADFEQLALPLLPSLYNHAFWLTRNHAEAEDLAQKSTLMLRSRQAANSAMDGSLSTYRLLQ
jgi:DNA-directed RNA polymerase specialized sigma24 family protein